MWPSDRVPQGGMFQPAKSSFNSSKSDFLNVLMNETRMSTMQRDKATYSLRSANAPPCTPSSTARTARSGGIFSAPSPTPAGGHLHNRPPAICNRPGSGRRRGHAAIVSSGAYDRDRFRPVHPHVDRDAEKRRLQDRMAYGDDVEKGMKKAAAGKRNVPKVDGEGDEKMTRFEELMKEIKDREEWLADMEELGEGPKHTAMIEEQIRERLREIDTLKMPS